MLLKSFHVTSYMIEKVKIGLSLRHQKHKLTSWIWRISVFCQDFFQLRPYRTFYKSNFQNRFFINIQFKVLPNFANEFFFVEKFLTLEWKTSFSKTSFFAILIMLSGYNVSFSFKIFGILERLNSSSKFENHATQKFHDNFDEKCLLRKFSAS